MDASSVPIAHLDQLLVLLLHVRLNQSSIDVQLAHIVHDHRISTAVMIALEHMLKQRGLTCPQET